MELLTSLQIQAYLRLWTLPKVTLFLNPHPLGWDIAIQQNMTVFLWQEAFPHDTCGSWAHPPTCTQCRMDGVWTGNSFWLYSYPIPVRVIQHPNTGTFTFLRETPRRGGRQQPHHSLKKFKKYKGARSATRWWRNHPQRCLSDTIPP
jgi:hypothetical protein